MPPHLQPPILLPADEAELEFISYQLGAKFDRGVLTVWFSAIEYGGIAVPRYYNVALKSQKSFIAPRGGALVNDFRRIFTRPIGRLDRFPIQWLKDVRVLGKIGPVTKDANQNEREVGTEYSVVRGLLKCL